MEARISSIVGSWVFAVWAMRLVAPRSSLAGAPTFTARVEAYGKPRRNEMVPGTVECARASKSLAKIRGSKRRAIQF
jgi:hypothetical protein